MNDHPRSQKSQGNNHAAHLKLTKPVVVSLYAEAFIRVRSDQIGILCLIPEERLMRKRKVSIPHGIIDALQGSPLVMKIANFSSRVF